MHTQQRNWIKTIKDKFPTFFENRRVLEFGSVNINGSIRDDFTNCDYVGVDVAPAQGVDVVSIAHKYNSEPFDVVYSTSELEHDMYWVKTLKKMVELLNPGGLMFFSCGSLWEEHGTEKYQPGNSLSVGISKEWANYYKNITPNDVTSTLDLNKIFSDWNLSLDSGMDLTFWGVKR